MAVRKRQNQKRVLMDILIRNNASDVATTAADILARYARAHATIGVATGSTPLATYRELIRRHQAGELSFAGCRMFALDEYVGLDYSHPESYHAVIHRELTDQLDIDPTNVHVPDAAAEDLQQACRDYEAAIEDAGGIDIQLLGIGGNGHIGFNEPGSSFDSLTRLKTLHPATVRDNARFFDSPDEVPVHVLTQGLGTIRRAGHLLLLATGQAKADAIAAALEGPLSASVPASLVQLHRQATIVVDEAAASGLKNVEYYRFVDENRPEWQQR